MLRYSILISCLGLILSNAEATGNNTNEYNHWETEDLKEVLTKSSFYYRAFNCDDDKVWVTKGKLFHITIYAQPRTGYFYYIGVSKDDHFITDGSLQSAIAIFEKEGLAQLDSKTIREIVNGFLFRSMANPDANQIVCKDYYSVYKQAVKSEDFPVPEFDFLSLKKLIGKNIDEPIVVQFDKSCNRWTAKFYVITGTGRIESWEFSGINDKTQFTVDKLKRKLLDIKVKRLEFTG